MNKRYLPYGVYINRQYSEETENNRRILRPIPQAAKRDPELKRKSKMEGDVLIIKSKIYTLDNLHNLPEEISAFNSTSETNGNTLGFFGELNIFSKFRTDDIQFNSSEQ